MRIGQLSKCPKTETPNHLDGAAMTEVARQIAITPPNNAQKSQLTEKIIAALVKGEMRSTDSHIHSALWDEARMTDD